MLLDLKKAFMLEGAEEEISCEVDLSALEFYGVYPFTSPVKVMGIVRNQNMIVRLSYHALFEYSRECDRCLEPVRAELDYEFEHLLSAGDENSEYEDVIFVSDYRLELDEVVREDILLELPTVFLCSPDCAGLCRKCGCNLNNESCDCDLSEHDTRFDALYELL